jgi:hypothetical protein
LQVKTSVTDVPDFNRRLVVDGQIMEVEKMAVLVNDKIGQVTYGKSPSGEYDQWAYHEAGGGGSAIIPFSIVKDQIYIGVVTQSRPFQSNKPVANTPRGFMDPNTSHFQTALLSLLKR